MAEVARDNNYVRPKLVGDPCLDIRGGRHPLQELCVERFVPNSTEISPEAGVIKLITGKSDSFHMHVDVHGRSYGIECQIKVVVFWNIKSCVINT